MLKYVLKCILIIVCLSLLPTFLSAQSQYTLSTMPRIDVHAHVGSLENMAGYVQVTKILKEEHKVNLEIWIDLSSPLEPGGKGEDFIKEAQEKYPNRFLPCINHYRLSGKLKYSPEELAEWKERGVVGFKIWTGLSTAINNPVYDPTFTKMEEIGMVGASVHVAQPYPTRWCKDPIDFWKSQNAWQRVLDRHPDLVVVNAHMLDLFNSDEQLDYLKYMLETYPNFNVDLAARFQQFHMMDRDNLRKFMIKYSDRILFGTDISSQPRKDDPKQVAEQYMRCFKLLETDEIVKGGFFGEDETKGLALPQDVLEKIYYKNAARLYPRVKDVLKELGYPQ